MTTFFMIIDTAPGLYFTACILGLMMLRLGPRTTAAVVVLLPLSPILAIRGLAFGIVVLCDLATYRLPDVFRWASETIYSNFEQED